MPLRRILHLVGSPTNDFFCELSDVYARACIDALRDPARYAFVIALVTPDGLWRFPESLERDAIDACEPMTVGPAIARIIGERIDLALPQMFCMAGMTAYRALLDMLKIPYLGNPPAQMAIAADKAKARAIVASAGVRIPRGELLRAGDAVTLPPPLVIKPNDSDNSDGVSLARSTQEAAGSLREAFSFSDRVLVEQYIELGREVRCGVVVEGGELQCLPLEEYFVDTEKRPIRTRANKLSRDADNGMTLAAKESTQSWIVATDDPIFPAVRDAALRCHDALGCRQYSLFDFRIDPEGKPWFLEAGLYCSFSPQSVLATMMSAAGTPLSLFFSRAVEELLNADPTRGR